MTTTTIKPENILPPAVEPEKSGFEIFIDDLGFVNLSFGDFLSITMSGNF